MTEKISLADLAKQRAGTPAIPDVTAADPVLVLTEDRQALSTDERQKVDDIKQAINLLDAQSMAMYGVGAQRQLTSFSDAILSKVRAKDAGDVGNTLSDLLVKVKDMDISSIDGDSFWSKLPWANNLKKFLARYETLDAQLLQIENKLDTASNTLLKNIGTFDTLYTKNIEYLNDIQHYIFAGEEAIEEARTETLPDLYEEAKQSGDAMSTQLIKDFEDTLNRFEQKIHNLKLSRTIAMQTAPQIRLVQNNDKILVDKVQTAILHTLPLWKNQIVLALGLQDQKQVLELNRKINETTNDLLRKNAEMLKDNTIEVARESQKGIVEIETLKKVNQDLIDTIDEAMTIQKNGRAARAQAEIELSGLELQLRNTLLKHMDVRPVEDVSAEVVDVPSD